MGLNKSRCTGRKGCQSCQSVPHLQYRLQGQSGRGLSGHIQSMWVVVAHSTDQTCHPRLYIDQRGPFGLDLLPTRRRAGVSAPWRGPGMLTANVFSCFSSSSYQGFIVRLRSSRWRTAPARACARRAAPPGSGPAVRGSPGWTARAGAGTWGCISPPGRRRPG